MAHVHNIVAILSLSFVMSYLNNALGIYWLKKILILRFDYLVLLLMIACYHIAFVTLQFYFRVVKLT